MGDHAAAILCDLPCLPFPGRGIVVLCGNAQAEEADRFGSPADLRAAELKDKPGHDVEGLKLQPARRRISGMVDKQTVRTDSILIKSYAGRRLYNTVSLTYVSFDDLAEMILVGDRFVVRDAETGDDITRDILNRLH